MDVLTQKLGALCAIYISIFLNKYVYGILKIRNISAYIFVYKETTSGIRPNRARLTTLRFPAERPSFVDPRNLSDRPRGPASEHDSAIATFGGRLVSPISSAEEGDMPRRFNSWILSDDIANGSGNSAPIDRGLPLLAKSAARLMALAAKLAMLTPRPRDLSCLSRQDGKS